MLENMIKKNSADGGLLVPPYLKFVIFFFSYACYRSAKRFTDIGDPSDPIFSDNKNKSLKLNKRRKIKPI